MITEEKTQKSLLKILVTLTLIICIILLAQFAWAKYMSSISGNSKADIAKWTLKVTAGENKELEIDLASTRDGVQEAEVQSNYIGPGTSGKFIIEVDATGTEVSLEYNINLNIDYTTNNTFPKNLIFYSDSEMKNAIYHTDNGITINGYIAQNVKNKTIPHTIYWKWDFETGQTQADKEKNDEADSYWIGRKMVIPITVVGEQVNHNPTTRQYVVTFNTNGGLIEGYGNAENIIMTVANSESYSNMQNPSKDGYEFEGWYLDENIVSTNPTDWYNGALDISGNESSHSKRLCLKDYLKVVPNRRYEFITDSDSSMQIRMIHFYDQNKNFISFLDNNHGEKHSFKTPDNCAYIKVSLMYTDERAIIPEDVTRANPYLKIIGIIDTSTVIKEANHTFVAVWYNKNISNNPIDWYNGALNINGFEDISYKRICQKNYVIVSQNKNYTLTTDENSLIGIRMIHFYDQNKNFISYIQHEVGQNWTSNITFTTPENCKYIKVSLMYMDGRTITPEDVIKANPCMVEN